MKPISRNSLKKRRSLSLLFIIAALGIVWSLNELPSSPTPAERALPSAKPSLSPINNSIAPLTGTARYKIVIDAGHGGKDPGADGASGSQEHTYTLSLSRKVFDLLQQEPLFATYMTRTDDTFIELKTRAELANALGADAFVSIHGNTFTNPDISGTETYYYSDQSVPLANEVHEQLAKATGFRDRGVKKEGWEVLTHSNGAAILLEVGFLTNPGDEETMLSEAHQNQTAQAIVNGIKHYFTMKES